MSRRRAGVLIGKRRAPVHGRCNGGSRHHRRVVPRATHTIPCAMSGRAGAAGRRVDMPSLDTKLIERLTRRGDLTPDGAKRARREARKRGEPLSRTLVLGGYVDERRVAKAMARVNGLEYLELESFEPSPAVLATLSADQVRAIEALPVGVVQGALVVAVADPSNVIALDDLKARLGQPVHAVMAAPAALAEAIARYYPGNGNGTPPPREAPRTDSQSDAATLRVHDTPPRTPGESARRSSDVHDLTTLMLEQENFLVTRPGTGRTDDLAELETVFDGKPHESPGGRPGMDTAPGDGDDSGEAADGPDRPDYYYPDRENELATGFKVLAPDEALPTVDLDGKGEAAVMALLRHMIDDALAARAEELEYRAPSAKRTHARFRKQGDWFDLSPYPVKYHEAVIIKLRELAAVAPDEPGPVEAGFVLQGRHGRIPVTGFFSTTLRGGRAVLRFPENIPLLQRPLSVLGIGDELEGRINDRLGGRGGGLVFITSDYSRLADQIYSSLAHHQAMEGRSVISLARSLGRTLPMVTQLHCPDEADVADGLKHIATEKPDLGAVSSIPNAAMLREVMALAAGGGQSFLGAGVTADSEIALALYEAAGVDKMNLMRGLVAHIHVTSAPRLCGSCRQVMEEPPRRLPPWAEPMAGGDFHHAPGCEACRGSGRRGMCWIAEVFTPDPKRPAGAFVQLRSREEALLAHAREGWLDVRDVKA